MSPDDAPVPAVRGRGMFLFFSLAGILSAAPVRAAGLPNIAVMPLQAKGVTSNEADVITDGLVARLQQSGALRVMERAQMDQIMKEQGLSQSGACDGAECAVEVGKLLAVDQILVGSVGLLGKTYTLNIRAVNVSTGEVLKSSLRSRAGSIDDVLTRLVPETVADLTGTTPVRDKSEPGGPAVASNGSRWGWWVGGGVVVAAGAAAVVLLAGEKTGGAPGAPAVQTTTLNTSW